MSQFTTTAQELARWLQPAIATAGRDGMLPVLTYVRLEVAAKHALAISTDRFRASLSRLRFTKATGPALAHVPAGELARALALFRGRGRHNPEVTVSVTGRAVRLSGDGRTLVVQTVEDTGHEALKRRRSKIAPTPVNFPDVRRLIFDALRSIDQAEEPFAGPMSVSFDLLASFRDAAAHLRGEAALIAQASGGKTRPYVLRLGDDYVGVLMPRRMLADSDDKVRADLFTAGWADVLALTTKAPKELTG